MHAFGENFVLCLRDNVVICFFFDLSFWKCLTFCSADTTAPVTSPTPLPTKVPASMCECVAVAGLCDSTCDAYVPALTANQECMDAFANVVCDDGVDETLFTKPYYLLCPDQCLQDCNQHGGNDEATITCLKRRVTVLEVEVDQSSTAVGRLEENVTGECSAVHTDIASILERGCASGDKN